MLSVVGVGHSYGDVVIDNSFIEGLNIGTSADWILEKIGISCRRVTLPLNYIVEERNQDPSKAIKVRTKSWLDLAEEAIKMALKRASLDIESINLAIIDCVTPDTFYPAPSKVLQDRLNASGIFIDVTTACPAVALHSHFVNLMNFDNLPEYILCVTSATVSQTVDYNDRADGAIWGDGAAAMILSKSNSGKLRVLHTSFDADTTRADSVIIERFGHFRQDGRGVRNFSVRQTVRMIKEIREKFNLDFNKDIFIGHQANNTMLDQIAEACDIPDSNHWRNVKFCGNQAAAGALASLSEKWDLIQPSQRILIAVLGAGLTWGTLLLEANT
ncbi:MAG: hypothetical protein NZO16_05660 [Deltaproteobacteria bacterium]|nr:hypothetical protein [Deltaproteobacteria bacterium]